MRKRARRRGTRSDSSALRELRYFASVTTVPRSATPAMVAPAPHRYSVGLSNLSFLYTLWMLTTALPPSCFARCCSDTAALMKAMSQASWSDLLNALVFLFEVHSPMVFATFSFGC